MTETKRRYSKDEFARRGDALLDSRVRPNLTAADKDKFVAIDVDTGATQPPKKRHTRRR